MKLQKELPVIDLDNKQKELTLGPTFFYRLFMILSLAVILFASFFVVKEYNSTKRPFAPEIS